jgi:hypothetical protein
MVQLTVNVTPRRESGSMAPGCHYSHTIGYTLTISTLSGITVLTKEYTNEEDANCAFLILSKSWPTVARDTSLPIPR